MATAGKGAPQLVKGLVHVRAIVFDLDGVLVDTMPAIRAAWAEWALAHGVSSEAVLSQIHSTGAELIRKFTPTLDVSVEARAVSARIAGIERDVGAFDGSRELIAALPEESWAIVTSARREPALRHLAMGGLPSPRVLISAEDTPRGKPDPTGYRLAAERLGLAPADCVAIEDSPSGLRAALDAGMVTIGITNTHDAGQLQHAHHVIRSLRELSVEPDSAGLLVTLS